MYIKCIEQKEPASGTDTLKSFENFNTVIMNYVLIKATVYIQLCTCITCVVAAGQSGKQSWRIANLLAEVRSDFSIDDALCYYGDCRCMVTVGQENRAFLRAPPSSQVHRLVKRQKTIIPLAGKMYRSI